MNGGDSYVRLTLSRSMAASNICVRDAIHCKKRRVVLTHIWLLQFHTQLDNSRRITLP